MIKKSVEKITTKKYDFQRIGFSGGIFLGTIFLVLSLCSKFLGLFNQSLNFFFDLFSKIGFDLTYFGIFLGLIYSFILGFILFVFYFWVYSKLPRKI
ncbi:hypothetical protein GW932_00710 [archaeon]|nr:hypothetical protein [archaeon]